MYEMRFDEYLISKNKELLVLEQIYGLLSRSYWANQRPKETIRKSVENSICYGIYYQDEQMGFARVVTDHATMFWLCDVYIDENHRKKGLGKKLVEFILNDPELQGLAGILATKDAHELYKKYGFVMHPELFMGRGPSTR